MIPRIRTLLLPACSQNTNGERHNWSPLKKDIHGSSSTIDFYGSTSSRAVLLGIVWNEIEIRFERLDSSLLKWKTFHRFKIEQILHKFIRAAPLWKFRKQRFGCFLTILRPLVQDKRYGFQSVWPKTALTTTKMYPKSPILTPTYILRNIFAKAE
jgi:hypothetical protein